VLGVVLLLVLSAGGVLAGSVLVGHPTWAWGSVGLSAAAAVLLIVVQFRRRRSARECGAQPYERESAPGEGDLAEGESADPSGGDSGPFRGTGHSGGAGHSGEADTAMSVVIPEPGVEPVEESTDAADLLVVSELDSLVVVIDERPRYHLDSCAWLGGRETISVPVAEARELGFTPCGLCSPDATLAAQQRASR
jgi:hypothetical protein